jgi:Domain of unknown function (DUF362)
MENSKHVITRRDFLRTGSVVTVGSLIGLPLVSRAADNKSTKSRVILIRDDRAVDGSGELRGSIPTNMLDQAVASLTGAPDPVSAWRQLIRPDDIVGVKSNVWTPLPTPPALETHIRKRLREAGVSELRISVDDRGVRQNPIFKEATALINVRPMRTHHWSGLGTLLKNYIMFVPSPWMYHGNACERLGAVWSELQLKEKTRLNILVMLTPLFHGVGPHHFSRSYTWPYCGLIVSRDPVAADAVGARIIQAKRTEFFGSDRPISPPPRHIEAADTQFGLGNCHPDRIELVRLGWEKDSLI